MHAICGRESGHEEGSSCPRICSSCYNGGERSIAVAENSVPSDEEILDLVDDECVDNDTSELSTPGEPVAEFHSSWRNRLFRLFRRHCTGTALLK